MVNNMVVISVKFSIQQCLNYLSSMHSVSASVKGSWLLLYRFLCSTISYPMPLYQEAGHWQYDEYILLIKQKRVRFEYM